MVLPRKNAIFIIFSVIANILTGCGSLVVLPDGQKSVMSKGSNLQRSNFQIEKAATSGALTYLPGIRCIFKESIHEYGTSNTIEYLVSMTIKSPIFLINYQGFTYDLRYKCCSYNEKSISI